jgi:hypothetical protein
MFRLNRNKQKIHPNSLKESIFGYFSENLGLLFVWFGLLRNRSVCFSCFDIGSKHRKNRNFLFLVSRNKPKQTRNRSCFGLFRFEPKFIFVCFEDTLPTGHQDCLDLPGSPQDTRTAWIYQVAHRTPGLPGSTR